MKPAIENDFGEAPLLLSRITDDMAAIGVLGVFGSVLGTVFLGSLALPFGLLATAWDMAYAYRHAKAIKPGMENHLDAITALLRGEVNTVEDFEDRCKGLLNRAPEIEPFNLDLVRNSPAQHLLLVGETGSGKTTLAQHLAATLFGGKDIQAYDCDATPETWGILPVVGLGDDWEAIKKAMHDDLELFKSRKPDQQATPESVRIAEELPSMLPEVDGANHWLETFLRRGRKRGFALIGLSSDRNAESLLLKGKAALLSNFTIFYLAGEANAALDRVRDKQHRETLRNALTIAKRPALIQHQGQWYWWDVPTIQAQFSADSAPIQVNSDSIQSNSDSIQSNSGETLNRANSGTLNWLNRCLRVPFTGRDSGGDSDSIQPESPELAQKLRECIAELKEQGMNQNQIIFVVWGAKAGGSKAYQQALAKYRQLTS